MANTFSAQTAPQTTAEYEVEFELLMQVAVRTYPGASTDPPATGR